MKVYVYAICKNEEKFVERWVNSMKEADGIYVLDTGSTDDTLKKLKKLKVHVKKKIIKPWRFDEARNLSLDMVPEDADICVCTDLDEVFIPGWRKTLENIWENEVNHLRYNYNWSHDENNKPLVNFYIEKIHSRHGFKWINPVHEVLKNIDGNEVYATTDEITLDHYPDNSKSRSSYLPLLELAVKEDPTNDRNMHYLGREYMYYGKWNEAIDTLIKHLKLETATWKDERSASMRFISRCYKNLKRYDESLMWLNKAILETPYLRDPYMEMAILQYNLNNYKEVKKYCLEALKIQTHPKTYINEVFSFDYTVYDLLSIACFYLGEYEDSYKYVNMALDMKPNDERLLENKKLIEDKLDF